MDFEQLTKPGEKLAYSIKELAVATGLPASTLLEHIRLGNGPVAHQAGRRLVVLAADAQAWLASLPLAGGTQ